MYLFPFVRGQGTLSGSLGPRHPHTFLTAKLRWETCGFPPTSVPPLPTGVCFCIFTFYSFILDCGSVSSLSSLRRSSGLLTNAR